MNTLTSALNKRTTPMDEIINNPGINDNTNDTYALYSGVNLKDFKSSDKVKRMLFKMGWKGQGLGKYEQGIVKPLIAKKTSNKFGIIIDSNIRLNTTSKINIKNFYNRSPTNIIMITNILTPEDINSETYSEIKEECENYGFINDIKFFHFTGGDLPLAESVRVFIEYDR